MASFLGQLKPELYENVAAVVVVVSTWGGSSLRRRCFDFPRDEQTRGEAECEGAFTSFLRRQKRLSFGSKPLIALQRPQIRPQLFDQGVPEG